MCRLNCVGVKKSEYINVGIKKWLKKTAFRYKKVEAKRGYQIFHFFTSRAATWSGDAFVKVETFSFFSFISGSIAPKAMVGVSMDSLWPRYYYVMDRNPEIRNQNREIRFFNI